MITVFINGKALQVDTIIDLQQVLQLARESYQLDLANIAVAVNQHVVPKSQWKKLHCQQGDQIDLFTAVAGG